MRPTPSDLVHLPTERERRQVEPVVALSAAGWQHVISTPADLANLWGAAAYFGSPGGPEIRDAQGVRRARATRSSRPLRRMLRA